MPNHELPRDVDEVKRVAQQFIQRYGSKHRAEHYAMDRQNKQFSGSHGKAFWYRVAEAIRKWR
jgi:hypothetical protein